MTDPKSSVEAVRIITARILFCIACLQRTPMASYRNSTSDMDDRLAFLIRAHSPDSVLPIQATFQHRCLSPESEVEMHYWPPRNGNDKPPLHFTYFILGQSSSILLTR